MIPWGADKAPSLRDDTPAEMKLFPFVAAFATYCFVWSYGIQKRRWWAWYLGWVFGAMAAVVIVYLAIIGLCFTVSGSQTLINALVPGGAACVWVFWARWWYVNRSEFLPGRKKPGETNSEKPEG